MKENELMIGDWVKSKKWREKPFKLTRINDYGKYYYGITTDGIQVGTFLLEEIEPLPIQRIHLTKNGFKARDIEDTLFVFRDGYTISVQFDEGINDTENDLNIPPTVYLSIKFAEKDIWIPIEYIHELQHAMKLFGIDKEIEL